MSPSDLQGPLIQGAVLALDPVAGASLHARVLGTCEDGTVLLQTLWCWVLGTREHLWTQNLRSILQGAQDAPEPRVGLEGWILSRRKLEGWLDRVGRDLGNLRGVGMGFLGLLASYRDSGSHGLP